MSVGNRCHCGMRDSGVQVLFAKLEEGQVCKNRDAPTNRKASYALIISLVGFYFLDTKVKQLDVYVTYACKAALPRLHCNSGLLFCFSFQE